MNAHLDRVAENILPLSEANSLHSALQEWYFTDRTYDHEQATENCQLCDQEQLRYHFEIENRKTKNRLWVGSSCILKFDVAVFDGVTKLDKPNAKKKLSGLVNTMRLASCLSALKSLAEKEDNEILSNALNYYSENEYLTPKYAFVVMWRLRENSIDHHPSFFKVSLKRDKYKNDLEGMPKERAHLIWPCLSSSQRKIAEKLGHSRPG